MDEYTIPVYLITGFLESGKTSFLEEVFESGEFSDGDAGIYLRCEQGEEEADPKALKACNLDVIDVDSAEDLTEDFFKGLEEKYHPQRIFVEYNGMWDPDYIINAPMPKSWGIYQVVTLIDAGTFGMVLGNGDMKSIIGNILKCSEMVIFNRCREDLDLAYFRRNVKAINTSVQMIFEHEDGQIIELGKDVPPFDVSGPEIDIDDIDYGLWYVDAIDDQERYDGKTVHFRAKVMKNRRFPKGFFVPGRNVMTCCAADIRFCGFLCKTADTGKLQHGQWIDLTADVRYERRKEYSGIGPVLYARDFKVSSAPVDDVVSIN